MTTAPNGELRRQDLHLQVQQLVSLRSLPGVAWASLPHLRRYYASLRLPPARLGPLRWSLASRYLACFRQFVVSPSGSCAGPSPPRTPGLLVVRSPLSGSGARRQVALPSSRVTPGDTCPALRPRWSPVGSPQRLRDCCLPVPRNRRLSPLHVLRVILMSTIIKISGLHHAACILVPSSFVRPLLGVHVEFPPDWLARLWSGGT